MDLSKLGMSDERIVAYVKPNTLSRSITSEEILEWKEAGISDEVIKSMLCG